MERRFRRPVDAPDSATLDGPTGPCHRLVTARVADLERKMDIHDLNQFTPSGSALHSRSGDGLQAIVAANAATTPALRQRKYLRAMASPSLDPGGKSATFTTRPTPTEGRIMIVIYAGWDAVDAGCVVARFCARTNDAIAYGEVVWS
jgi:hypothetical protein